MKFELHPEARARFHEIQEDLRASNPKRARAFAAEMRRLANVLRKFPRAGVQVGALRRMVLHRFPYSVLYAVDGDLVRITTIEPQQREPDYWADEEDA